jgi:hypothetical protein
MRNLLTALTAAGLIVGGLTACATDGAGEDEIAELDESGDDSKTDQPDIALTVLDIDPPKDRFSEKVGVIKSRSAFKTVFGYSAPSSIDFNKQWVAYYTAGTQTSGGYHATIERVRLSDTGKTLRITANLDRPGFDCVVTQALTAPYAVVKFAKPSSAPTTNRYYREESTTNCSQACAGTTENETVYEAETSSPHGACTLDVEHCVTNDSGACPQLTPLPPTFCSGGTIRTIPNYIASADGMECSLPSIHCVTNDSNACPQFSPLPPDYCPTGTRLEMVPGFIQSADGMECYVPSAYCVNNASPEC